MTKHPLEQETPAWLVGLSDTLLLRLIGGRLQVSDALPQTEEAST